MKISVLLPYKENFSPEYPGAVSIFLNGVTRISKFKKFITVYGNTNYRKKYPIRYKNITISNKLLGLGSQTSKYINSFMEIFIFCFNINSIYKGCINEKKPSTEGFLERYYVLL